jgi:hypothetical protein
MRASDALSIDDYLLALDSRLRGPARVKADLVAEARGGLEDAAEAYVRDGLDPRAAQERAVADFGAPDELAPAYQAELTAGQGRRLALVLALLPAGMLTADSLWWRPPGEPEAPPTLFLFMVQALDWISYAVGALALLALFLLGAGGRRMSLQPHAVVRPLAVTALVACALIWSLGTYAAVNAVVESPQALTWPPMIAAWIMLNTVFGLLIRSAALGVSATRRRSVGA